MDMKKIMETLEHSMIFIMELKKIFLGSLILASTLNKLGKILKLLMKAPLKFTGQDCNSSLQISKT